ALKRLPYAVYEGYYRVFQHASDLVGTLVRASAQFVPGATINVGGAEYVSVKQMHEEICKHVDVDPALVTFLPEEKHNVTCKRPDITLAKTLLGHNPSVLLADGIPKTIDWMRAQYL
ncbi:MAG: NAD-dependent epimerase/dehydratase family protein, partial [Steroidobacteraceae bacterium]